MKNILCIVVIIFCNHQRISGTISTDKDVSFLSEWYPKDSCQVLKVRTRNKICVFHVGMYTSMKFNNDSVYIMAKIVKLTSDSIKIFKREYIDGEYKNINVVTYPINELKWINWDGIPRKKLRLKRHTFFVEDICNSQVK